MDLISIRRKYNNIRNIIIISFILVVCAVLALIVKEINKNKAEENVFLSYSELKKIVAQKEEEIQKQKEEQQKIEE